MNNVNQFSLNALMLLIDFITKSSLNLSANTVDLRSKLNQLIP